MNTTPLFVFEYAIKYPNGTYYTGRVTSPAEPTAHQGKIHEAFTYTERRAHDVVAMREAFNGCTVERVIF